MDLTNKRVVVYAGGAVGAYLKTSIGVLRYAKYPVVAIVDPTKVGQSVESVFGVHKDLPILGSIAECAPYNPDVLLLGAAPIGGVLPATWQQDIILALQAGMGVVSGLHSLLASDPEIAPVARELGRQIWDVREPLPQYASLTGTGKALTVPAFIVGTVGTDAGIGKMTASLELTRAATARGIRAKFLATGQTGMMIEGDGVAIDRVIADFMAGAAEKLVLDAGNSYDLLVVEGQGALAHPAWSGVTLALLHGSCPHTLVLCHDMTRTERIGTKLPVPSLTQAIAVAEMNAASMRPARVCGIFLNTSRLSDQEAKAAIQSAEAETGLPAADTIRYGADKLLEAILQEQSRLLR